MPALTNGAVCVVPAMGRRPASAGPRMARSEPVWNRRVRSRAMSILGNRVLRKEDPKFLTTGGVYVDDLPLPGAAYVTYVRSTMAHATITVDVSEAKSAPGVVAIFTGNDVSMAEMAPGMPMLNQAM